MTDGEPSQETHLPHQIVVLEQVHVFRGQDFAREGAHLRASLDPRFGEDTQTFSWDGALCDDHLAGEHQTGQFLHLWEKKKEEKKRIQIQLMSTNCTYVKSSNNCLAS